jgi:peroxin-19
MLNDFSAVRVADTTPAVTASGPGRPSAVPDTTENAEDTPSEDDFARQLQAGMANLLGEIESSVLMPALCVCSSLQVY